MNPTAEARRLEYRQWSRNDIHWSLCQCVSYMTACFTVAFTQLHRIRRLRPATCVTDVTSVNWCDEWFSINLTFMEPCVARCVFYITNEMQLIQYSLLLSALYMFRAKKLNSSNPSAPAVDSRQAWQYPRLHIQFYKLLMMVGKTSRNW
jgi:hypothetical protein